MAQSPKPVTSPVPESLYPTLAALLLTIGLVVTASFFMIGNNFQIESLATARQLLPTSKYEATSSRKNRSLVKEVITGAVSSVFLGFGSLFLLLSTGVYV